MNSELSEEDLLLSREEVECRRQMTTASIPLDGRLYCGSVWDGWGCWNYTEAGRRAFINCPSHIQGFDPELKAYKDCTEDGTWWRNPFNKTWSNYTACINQKELEKNTHLIYVYISGYSVSMAALTLSLVIFTVFRRQLQCDRVTLHNHLFGSYVLNDIAWISYYVLAALNADVLEQNPGWCQGLHVLTQYLVTCNYVWMFCEGIYLHTIIAIAFTSTKRLLRACYVVGWGLPVVTTLIYTAVRANSLSESQRCWIKESNLQWIVSGVIVFTLVTNLVFLFNIIRVLVTKLRAVNSPDTIQAKKAVRATVILIPLLGVQFVLFPMKPPDGTLLIEIYFMTIALVTSLQGLFVAALFCFFNGEVMTALSRRWQRRDSALRRLSVTQTVTLAPASRKRNSKLRPTASSLTPLHNMTSHDDASDNLFV